MTKTKTKKCVKTHGHLIWRTPVSVPVRMLVRMPVRMPVRMTARAAWCIQRGHD
ncbi:MAG: hypothetical protein ACYYKD_07585 [Rhodospirillales bacterium]